MKPGLQFGKVAKSAKEGREWLILLLSLLLAFFIWSIHNLSLEYSSHFRYQMTVVSNITGHRTTPVSSEQLIVRGKATGFYILKNKYSKHNDITITIDASFLNEEESQSNLFRVSSDAIKEIIIEALMSDVQVEYVANRSFSFIFPKVNNKKVPIKAKLSVSYKPQYMQIGTISIQPDSVLIYGEETITELIDSVYTENISIKQLDHSTQGIAKLISLKGITYSGDQVFYSIKVDRFVESSYSLPVVMKNVPKGKEFLFIPSSVTLTCRHSLDSNRDGKSDGLNLIVDYNDYLTSIDAKLIPHIDSIPEGVFSIAMDPPFVECVAIEQKSR